MKLLRYFTAVMALWAAGMTGAQAQLYDQALGLRGGVGATVTYKKFVSEPIAFEAILGLYDYDYFGLGLLLQKHKFVGDLNRLLWYWGVGPYVTFGDNFTGVGVSGALGLDLSFEAIPIDITLDWLPRIRLVGGGRFLPSGGGVGIRYIIDY